MEEQVIKVLGIKDIMARLPHRYPFLLIDKAKIIETGKKAVGIKNVTVNEPQFTGHFPENPVMPGVLIIEAMAQTAAMCVMDEDSRKGVFFMSVESAKFRKPVVPGDQMEITVEKEQGRRNVFRFKGEVKVDGALHAEAIFTAMIYDEKK